MALDRNKLRRTAAGCADGEVRYGVFHYKTNDARAAIETDGYFDEAAEHFTEGVGDVIHIVADADGAPGLFTYLVTRTAGDIALTLSSATAAAWHLKRAGRRGGRQRWKQPAAFFLEGSS